MRFSITACALTAIVLAAASAHNAAAAPAVVGTNVNLRQGPGTNYTAITLIPAGATVEVNGCNGQWCQVSFGGQNGYVIATSIGQGPPGGAPPGAPPGGPQAPPGAPPPPPGPNGPVAVAPGAPPPGYYPPPPGYYAPPGYYYPPPAYYDPYYYGNGPYWRGYYRRW